MIIKLKTKPLVKKEESPAPVASTSTAHVKDEPMPAAVSMGAAPAEPGKKKKRLLAGLDMGLVEEGGRSTKRRAVEAVANTQAYTRQKPDSLAQDLSPEEVQSNGLRLWQMVRDAADGDRLLSDVFMTLPSREEYPDYYEIIKRPISLQESKLESGAYTKLEIVRDDIGQVFANAKRYNAPGYAIFEDAKYLHRLLRSRYNILTGAADVDDEKLQQLKKERLPTLKGWLQSKLDELLAYKDPNGRPYCEFFLTLIPPEQYPDYYRVITQPMAFDTVQAKIKKRSYQTWTAFRFDVDLIFANAKYYNEDTSRVWKDAAALERKFAEITMGGPPDFAAIAAAAEKRDKEGMKLKLSLGGANGASISQVPTPAEPAFSGRIKLKLSTPSALTPAADDDGDEVNLYDVGTLYDPSGPEPIVARSPAPIAPPPPPPRIIRHRTTAKIGGQPALTSLHIRPRPYGPAVDFPTGFSRQHAVLIPRSAESIEITPIGSAAVRAGTRPQMSVSNMPDPSGNGRTAFVLRPPANLVMATLEIFAKPMDGLSGEEVYRLFFQRLPM